MSQIVNIILSRDRKYVVGFPGTVCCTQYMAHKPVFLLSHIVPVIHADATAVESLIVWIQSSFTDRPAFAPAPFRVLAKQMDAMLPQMIAG